MEISKIGLQRLREEIFGSGRAARSSDAVIFNKSGYQFRCTSSKCDYGGYSSSLLPEPEILAKQCTLFGMESVGLFRGLGCTTKYESDDGTFFELKVENPYYGQNSVSQSHSPNLFLVDVVGSGKNNQVRLIVEDRNNYVLSSSNSQAATPSKAQTYGDSFASNSQTSTLATSQTYTDISASSTPSTTQTYEDSSASTPQTSNPSTTQTVLDLTSTSVIDETLPDINYRM